MEKNGSDSGSVLFTEGNLELLRNEIVVETDNSFQFAFRVCENCNPNRWRTQIPSPILVYPSR